MIERARQSHGYASQFLDEIQVGMLMIDQVRESRGGADWFAPLAIQAIGAGAGLLLVRPRRRPPGTTATTMGPFAPDERPARTDHEESS